jgi:hypothetical protein
MPTYRYRAVDVEASTCDFCSKPGFETIQKLSEAPVEICPECKESVRRVIGKIECMTNRRWNTKKMLKDDNLKRLGFKKLVKQSDGNYRDVLADR